MQLPVVTYLNTITTDGSSTHEYDIICDFSMVNELASSLLYMMLCWYQSAQNTHTMIKPLSLTDTQVAETTEKCCKEIMKKNGYHTNCNQNFKNSYIEVLPFECTVIKDTFVNDFGNKTIIYERKAIILT